MSSRIIRADSTQSKRVTPFEFSTFLTKDGPPNPEDRLPVSSELPPPSNDPSPSEVEQSIRASAEQQSELLIRQAKLKASEIEKEAYEKGFSEGEKAGREVGEKMMEALLKQYSKGLEELNALPKQIFASSEREVVRLSLEIAKKIVKREVNIDEELILALVRVALSRLAEQNLMTVRVNPRDYHSIIRHQAVGSPSGPLNEGIKLVEDPLIARGGFVIETESGMIDARVEEQFREIEKGFFE